MTAIRDPLRTLRSTGHLQGRRGLLLLIVLAAIGSLLPFGDRALHALRYEREALQAGQAWRLVSAHFVHLNALHAAGDALALVLLWLLFAAALSPRTWLAVLLASMAAIDAGLWWLSPGVQWYAGISGLLHGAWAAGAAAGAVRREPVALLLLLVLVLKLAREQLHGASLLFASFPVVVDSHLYGAVGALLALGLLALAGQWRQRSRPL
ncbi:MAG: hypothetical protein RL684_637 [Pseudomonadota bacterium]|jgi:rhomboid family GlyGly-CTERM serine protease